MKIFSFQGWSGSGKTTLITRLIRELSIRGWRVMAVKKAAEKYHLEPEGKDSRRFLEHGAGTVYLVAKKQIMKMKAIDKPEDLFKIAENDFKEHDFILIEGLAADNSYIFEVYDPGQSDELKTDTKILSAVISEFQVFDDMTYLNRDDITGIADYLEKLKKS